MTKISLTGVGIQGALDSIMAHFNEQIRKAGGDAHDPGHVSVRQNNSEEVNAAPESNPLGAARTCLDGCGSSHMAETNHYFVCCVCGMTYTKS